MKTYKDIDIKYYDNDGNIHVRCSVPVTQDALVHYELMQSHYCKLSFKLTKPTYFLLGDFIDTPYGRFELIDLIKAKDNDTIGYSYEIQFDAYYRKLKNKILKYRPNTGSQEATFSLTSKISTHVEVIMKSLAYYAKLDKSYLYDPKFEGEGTDYTYVIDASVDANAAKLITYSNTSMLDAIAKIAQTFECEWWFEGNILHFGTCENTNAIVDFRLNDNIVSMSSSQSQSTYANRVYAFGAARNLPSGYKNDADADITKDGVVEKRLMLPTSAECSDKNKQLLAENGFELKNGYIQVGGLHEDQYVEGVTTNDDIYPRNLIKTSKVTSYEKDVEDESTPEEGDYIKRTFYRVNSLTIVNDDGEKTGDMAFRKAYILSGKNLHIVFQSGSLNGMDFECEFNPDGVSEILRDNDGNPILKDGKEQINPKSQVFEIVANEDYGRFLPDTALHPKDGDTFVLYNWNSTKLGDTLVSAASNELLTDSIKNLKKSMIDPTTYTCTAEANYSFSQGRGNFHGVGDRVNLYNKGYDDSYRSSRIIGYELNLDIPYDGAKYYVGEKPSYSRLNAMESKIEELVYNGQSYLNGNGGSGRSIYIIKSYDSITPTDYNVFSAKAVDEQRLNKTKDDTAHGTITWEKIQKLLSGLLVGNFNSENGGSWTPDAEGRSHLITDYLEVRMKAIFEELVIKKTSTISGKEIISPAGGVVAHKVEEVTVTYNNVSQKAYRCYFLAEQDSDAVDNDFAVNDQVRSESFNVRKGTYHKVGNHFYWRLAIGRDEDPVELEGKKYHYIDLSDTDCATASDVPAKGDVLNQCGNRTDVERQNCLIFSAVDTYSPSISLYHGINSYSFANKEYVEYGVNKQTNKAFFNVYGDMYVGDRPTKENGYEGSSYIKYDSAAKQVSVKGKISAKSTVDGKELSQYIKENSAKGLTEEQVSNLIKNSQVIADLQNQVDGAIETWFYEGVPTLKNAPASSWATDKEKDTHLGDLYYDNKTGKAYRFAKDGNTYKWTIITDTDIAKALSDASKAQETADGKMKVFSTQPNPPYQVGDIWVNATYPADGSTYKNEVLRCQTLKAAGSPFAIADWIKASKYTDDTVANAAKAAAEKAQKAAEKAQGDISKLGTTVTTNKKAFDSYVTDGYLEPSEIAAMAQDSKRLEDDFAAAQKSYNEVKEAEVLANTNELIDLKTAFDTLTTAKTELVTYLSDISARYNASDTNGKATIVSAVGTKFTNFQSAYSAFYDKLGLANAYITSKIYGDLKQNITDLAGYKYLKDALGQTTYVDGGLVMTTLLALRDGDGNVQSGINGAIDKNRGKKSIATWWGGQMVDKDYNSGNLTPATSLIRFDGSGYLANGAIWWDVSGKVHADPTSFIISEKNLGAYLIFFEPTWKEGSAGTSVADLVSLKPNAPFSKLGVSGDATFEGAISFHGIKITYDATNKAIKIDGNLYATGGITAYGAGASTTGGGGLIASVISYARIIEGNYTDADLTSIPNAYAIKALSSRIDNIASELGGLSLSWNNITGKPSTFTPSAHTHKWTEITDRITKVSQLTNDAGYLTTHQSLASYYTKSSVDSLLSGKSATSHTHSVKINGVTKTIAATGGTAVDLGTYLTSHQTIYGLTIQKNGTSLGTYTPNSAAKTINVTVPTKLSELSNDSGYTKNTGTVTSVAISVPTGLSVSGSPITTNGTIAIALASGYSIPTTAKQTAWDGAVSAKHTHSNKSVLDGISSTKVSHWNSAYDWYALMTTDEETADGIINKWNEVVSFLANIAQTDTLSGIVDGINKSISDEVARAKKAEGVNASGISTNKTSITTLQGYFTSGSAKKALQLTNTRKLWGNSFNGTADINGSIIVPSGKYISIGNIKLEYDATNKALKITNTTTNEVANLYTSGGVSAYGVGTSSSSGGGLNGSVKSYSDALKLTSESLSEIASAYSIKALDSRISSLEGGSAMDVSVSGSGNAVTAISKSGTTIIVTKGTTFLTSHQSLASYLTKTDAASLYQPKGNYLTAHQSLDGYVNAIAVSGSGNAVTAVTKSGKTITFTKGATYLTSHQSLSNYYTKSSVDSLLSGKSATSHTHSVKINGVTKTIAATGGAAVDLGTYLTSHQSLADYAKKSEIPTKVSQLTNDTGYITSSGSCAYATNADKVDGVHVTWAGELTSTNHLVAWEADGSALRDIKPANVSVGNSDKLDGIHANGLLTALSNSDKGISITVGGTTKSISNISVNYASNADTVDGEHASAFTKIVGRHGIYTSGTAPYNYIHLFRIANSSSYSTLDCEIDFRTRYHSAKLEIRISTAQYPYNSGGTSISIVKKVVSGRSSNFWILPTVQTSNYNYYDVYYESGAWNSGSYGITSKGNNGTLVFEHKGTNLTSLPDKVIPVSNNVATSATKLQTPRTIWGQSFDGTGNVSGSLSGTGTITASAAGNYDIGTNNLDYRYGYFQWIGAKTNTNLRLAANNSDNQIVLHTNGNVGIGTNSPAYKLHVSGEIYTTTKVNINGIILEKDSNGDLKVNGNLYATGGISAYGTSSAGSGGGLSGSVKSYADALKLASESLSEIASAYSIKQLSTRITSLEGGSATSISVSGGGNAVTSVTKNGTTISVVKGSTFSLSGHTHKWADITDRPSSLKNPSALSWSGYSSGSYDGSAAKSISIPNNTNQLTNGAGFITASASITGNAATATKVNHSLSVFGKSFNGSADVTVADTDLIASILTATANLTDKTEILTSYASNNGFNDSNSKNRIYRRPASAIWGYINSKTISNADKLDNVHLNGIFTALSNTNNGVSMTIGTVAKSLANMQVYSATKLVTARNIALNGDFTGNANFDGSANITINGYMSYCNATVSNTNTYPWRRIAKVNEITGNYSDGCILLYISEGFNGGYYGIARIYIRTDNLSTGANASCSIQWISRNGYGLDSLKIAMYKTTGKAYYDVFLKMRGAYGSVVIRTLQDMRGGLSKRFTLVNSTEGTNAASHTEAYATIEDAATSIHNQAYTSIAQGSDVATVHNADMVDGIHASGLFTNLSNSGNSLSITVGGTNKTLTVNYASNAGNADTVDSLHVHSGRNSEANKIVRTDGNGFIQCGYINSDKGNEGNNSSPARVWGTNGSDNYLRSYLTSALSVKYAASAGNADTLDGVHASGLFTNLSNSGNNISITIGGTNKTLTAAYATNCDTVDGYHAQLGSSKPYGKIPVIGTDGVIELGHYIDFHHDNTTGSDYSVRLQTNGNHSNVVTLPTATGTLALTSGNVASATKLQTARTIWGQSFNGTANVSGALSGATTISASNTISTTLQNGALKIGNKLTPISAIDAQVIFNTGAAIRFGEKNWNWDEWAGLKYTHSNKTVYLGIADGSVFNANNAQSYGKLQLKAIDSILFDSDSDSFQIYCDNSHERLRIGSSDNSGYVLVSDIGNWDTDGEDEDGANNWRISIDGSSWFKKIYCPSIYTANSINSTSNKALLLSGNVIREYHHGGSIYYSSITFNDTTLALSAYGNIGLTSTQGITIDGGNGRILMVATGGFDVTYRAASLSVSQTGASEYTWTFNNGSIKTTGGITAYQSSDERLKHDIHGVDSLAIIKAMGGTVSFRYNADNKDSIGWIAQRVLHNTFMQDLVEKDDKGFLKINYWSPKLIAVAFGAIEQVDDEVSRLKRRVRDLENEVEQLKSDRL